MRIKRKLNSQSGFTLAETLLAVLILLLVSVIVANGIPVAQNVYNNVIVGANAQVLLSTAVSALRNELGTARDVKCIGTTITYYKPAIRSYSQLSVDAEKGIQLLDYVYLDEEDGIWKPQNDATRTPRNLVSNSASNKNLIVTYDSVAISDDDPAVITFTDLEIIRTDVNGSTATLTTLNKLNIRFVPELAP